jgi:uncharacterized protein (TIGR02996 family)
MMIMSIEGFLQAIIADPLHADATWQVLADWLEDHGDARQELVRLLYQPEYRRDLSPEQRDSRMRELLASGMQPIVATIVNSIGMRFALIPAGTFLMGSPTSEEGRINDETQRLVEINQPFFLGVFPVTQEEYQRVTGRNPSQFSPSGNCKQRVGPLDTRRFPVETVSHNEAIEFCRLLAEHDAEKTSRRCYRLPTEAEWEYSCRGGALASSPFYLGDALSSRQANFDGKYPYGGAAKGPYLGRTSEAGSYPANAYGLFDMHGNVWEWCSDGYAANEMVRRSALQGPAPDRDYRYGMRGGSWLDWGWHCRSGSFIRQFGDYPNNYVGFRVVCVVNAS